ncbi:unnamed protein product [Blepharisma stoltei]|uniref:NADH dehydrogenase subunit 11 n=1 Tax=Blepharisma stoltei TaxID=1481888 RepID=A0AAU9JHX1_9CILI|nr:unnamed protein product [Blepharisma stoltei]
MCLTEIEKIPKPVVACAWNVAPNMSIKTKSEMTYNARGGVMEFLLANHPLDCPICDQGGECDLQDQSLLFGYKIGRFIEYKRSVEDKKLGPLINTIMTRCIHCTRCIRFLDDVAGNFVLGTSLRSREMEIVNYVERLITSELSGNVVDLCPVGALTNAPYAFTARPWELRSVPTFDVEDGIMPAIEINSRRQEIMRILPRVHEEINEEWVHDRSRHAYDGLKRQRINACLKKNPDGSYKDIYWQEAFEILASKINEVSGEEILGIIGEHMDLESVTAFRDLLYSLGCENIETVSNTIKISPDFRSNYLMNSKITGIEESDLILIVGANMKIESPVLNARIKKAIRENDASVALIGTPDYLSYDYLHLGNSLDILHDIINKKHPFSKTLEKSKFPMIIVSSLLLQRNDGEAINALIYELAQKFKMIQPENNWNGYNVLHFNVGPISTLEVGITTDIETKVKPKFVYLLGADNYNRDKIPDDAFAVYQGTHGDEGAYRANLILPGAAYTEKNASYVNTDGRVLLGRISSTKFGDSREDWEIIRALSESLGKALPYDTLQEIRYRIAELAPHLIKYDYIEPYNLGWTTKPRNGKIDLNWVNDTVDNFYMTDSISRASPTMARCSEFLNPEKNTNFIPEIPLRK